MLAALLCNLNVGGGASRPMRDLRQRVTIADVRAVMVRRLHAVQRREKLIQRAVKVHDTYTRLPEKVGQLKAAVAEYLPPDLVAVKQSDVIRAVIRQVQAQVNEAPDHETQQKILKQLDERLTKLEQWVDEEELVLALFT